MWRRIILCGAFAIARYAPAQDAPTTPVDSLRHVQLGEVVIQGAGEPSRQSATVHRLGLAGILERDPATVDQVLDALPSATVRTNSRGETLIYLRHAGERQVGVYFDGALLNVPWDNRADLAMLPAAAIGGVVVERGAASVAYGTNISGGAVNLLSRDQEGRGSLAEAVLQAGSLGYREGAVLLRGQRRHWHALASVSAFRRDALPLPQGADLAHNQFGSSRRTNTDAELMGLFARLVRTGASGNRLGLTIVHSSGNKGVAPEGHVDSSASVRYWRYPDSHNTLGIMSLEHASPDGAFAIKGSAWAGGHGQDIVAYQSARYDRTRSREEDHDFTAGVRLGFERRFGTTALHVTGNGLVSTHEQRDTDLLAGVSGPLMKYRLQIGSIGAEVRSSLREGVSVVAGGSYDFQRMPLTGDKPAMDPMGAVAYTMGLNADAGRGISLRASGGQRTRFPTMRELFGEALGRFLINPALKPERSLVAEVGLRLAGVRGYVEVVPFVTRTADAIEQRIVEHEGKRLRQRINLKGSRTLGLEGLFQSRLGARILLNGHMAFMDTRRLQGTLVEPSRLTEMPDVTGMAALSYRAPGGMTGLIEADYTGRAYSLDESGSLVPLPRSLAWHARLSYRLFRPAWSGLSIEMFVRVDNLTDARVLPQLGLPAPGRTVRLGIKLGV